MKKSHYKTAVLKAEVTLSILKGIRYGLRNDDKAIENIADIVSINRTIRIVKDFKRYCGGKL